VFHARTTGRTLVMTAAFALALAACGPTDDPIEEPDDQLTEDPTDDPADDDGTTGEADQDEAAPTEDEPVDDTDRDDRAVEPLDAAPSTDRTTQEGSFGDRLEVTEVRVGTHDGFDRVTFELDGDGTVGWSVGPEDEPTSQGSGEPIEVAGSTSLWVALEPLTYPTDPDAGLAAPDRVTAPDDALVLTEVVQDTLFEGIHTFAIGLEEAVPFAVERLEDPQRVVIDLVVEDRG
jgi:hypothetical protein